MMIERKNALKIANELGYGYLIVIISTDQLEEEKKKDNDIQKYEPRYATGEEFIYHLLNDSEYIPIPAHLEKKDIFIKTIIELSQIYEIDTDMLLKRA